MPATAAASDTVIRDVSLQFRDGRSVAVAAVPQHADASSHLAGTPLDLSALADRPAEGDGTIQPVVYEEGAATGPGLSIDALLPPADPVDLSGDADQSSVGSDVGVGNATDGADADDAAGDDAGDGEATDTDDRAAAIELPLPEMVGEEEPIATLSSVTLDAVIDSVYRSYPLLRAEVTQRQTAAGQQLAAWGAYDYQITGATENQGVGFYENFRHRIEVSRDIFAGGRAFAGYRLGRGEFEPWYKERETNEGGEFKLGLIRPLRQGRVIDAQRAAVYSALYERQRVEPAIRIQLIDFVAAGSTAYWQWVAAGQRYELARELLRLAEERNRQIERRVEVGDLDPPALPENERLVLNRRGRLLDAERVLEQAIARLSLYYRTTSGVPIVVDDDARSRRLALDVPPPSVVADLPRAVANRPELAELLAQRRRQSVALAQAQNLLLPTLDAALLAKQDVGGAASSPDTKEDFELEASLFLDVPLQRRNARGRVAQAQAAMARLSAREQIERDRVRVDLEVAAAAIETAIARVEAAEESVELAKELVRVERRRFELGDASLLEVTLREQQLADSATDLINAQLDSQLGAVAYRAALGLDRLPEQCP